MCKGKRWAEVGRDLGYSGKIMSSLSTSLKNSYQKWLLPYEEYLRQAKPGVQYQLEMMNGGPYTPSPSTSPAKKPQSQQGTPMDVIENPAAMQATAALHYTVNGHEQHTPTAPQSAPPQVLYPPPPTSGFTPVNAGTDFAPINAPSQASSFTSVNGSYGSLHSFTSIQQQPAEPPPPPISTGPQSIAPYPNGVNPLKRHHSESILTPEEVDAINRRSKRLRKDVPTIVGSNMHHGRMGAARVQLAKDRGNFKLGEMCENCGKSEDSLRFITCHTCDSAYHMYCLEPPLKQPPDHEWHCPKCLVGTNDYGFEEGDVYSLGGFQRKANEFKTHHFGSLPPQFNPITEHKNFITEEDVEREFWRLVEDMTGSVEVEYGADIHSTTHGSGFPTIEKQPRDSYSADPWNLNILPLDKESLFRHIKSDISGMTVPWLYVGMVFSTFCWHNEDHYAYSANYQHFGQTKTWYGIPAEDSDKFENAMREEVPELFEMQPDLLFQLVTLARPDKLRKAGVRVYALDQHAGEFVITFPQAYHAGFNHGFNFNEAVNFAPHDWEPFGQEGARRLRDYRKQPCFSHDELLITASSRELTIRTAKWLALALERMRDAELDARKHFLHGPDTESGTSQEESYIGPRYEAEPELIDPGTEEDEVNCTYCKCYCYLSRYQCMKTKKWLCALHAGGYECCDALEHERYTGRDGIHRMHVRMTDDALTATVQKVVDKANVPEAWAAKVDSELDDEPRPSLKHLRTLLSEGERIQYHLPMLAELRRFVERCNEWVEEANNYITRKQQNRRKNEKAWRKSTAKSAEVEEREKELRNVVNVQRLLAKADEISFDCPEINTLRERAENIAEFQREANDALNSVRGKSTQDFEELVERGREFHVDIPEIDRLEHVVKRLRWDDTVKLKRPNQELGGKQTNSLKDIENFINEGVALGVPDHNMDLTFFREHKAQGEIWEQKAVELMNVEQVHYQQLDALSAQSTTLPVNPETIAAVEAILKKQREVQDKIASIIERSKDPEMKNRPTYKEMQAVLESLKELQSKPAGTSDLEKEQKRHEDWMRKGKKLFGKANAPLHILKQHMEIVRERNVSCFDISDKPRMPVEPSSRHATPDESMPVSDGSNSSRDVFCICRKAEAGMMIECEQCHEWYHGKCLKIARGKVKEDDKYTCPICDWRLKIPRDAARPKLEDLQAWYEEFDTLPFQPEEEDSLDGIIHDAQTYREFIRPIIHSDVPTTPEEIDTMRFHLRKIEGADILLAEETNFLRQELHKWTHVAPEAPPIIEFSQSTRKPRPTKQQKLMAQLGITDPEDLPQEYKIKYLNKQGKKIEEGSAQGSQQPLQPAGAEPNSRPGSANPSDGSAPPDKSKLLFTPLALMVLGSRLTKAPAVSKLQAEGTMNRDKLERMKYVLETDPSVWDDPNTLREKMKALPTPPAHMPFSYGYDAAQVRSGEGVASGNNRETPYLTQTAQPSSLASPPPQFGSPIQSYDGANAMSFDSQMFHGPTGGMFDSPPGNDATANGPGLDDMFRSPKPSALAHTDINHSPEFGSGMDNAFADLIHDHDTLDGVSDAKVKADAGMAVPTTEGVTPGATQMADTTLPDMQGNGLKSEQDGGDNGLDSIMYHQEPGESMAF